MSEEDSLSAPSTPTPAPRGRVRLSDIAERSGVTKSVVSRIMNDDANLRARPETRERVLSIARELGYRPHAGARALSVARSGALAFLIPDLTNAAYAAILRGAVEKARELDHAVLIAEDSRFQPAEADFFGDLVTSGRVDGLLVASAWAGNPLVDRLTAEPDRIAHVFVNREVPGTGRNVGLDMYGSTVLAIDYLRSHGHTAIGMVAGPDDLYPTKARQAAFVAHMKEVGLDASRVVSGPLSERGGYEAAVTLMREHPETTALYASTFAQGVGALNGLRSAGLSVPDDVSLISYDNLPLAEFLEPALTTLTMPLDELGAMAVDALIAQLKTGETQDRRVKNGYRIHERASVSSPRAEPLAGIR